MKLRSLWSKGTWIFSAALLILVIILRLPALAQPISNDIGANAYGARLILQGEALYGFYHPAHHLPAIYYTYALIFSLLGDHPVVPQLFLIPWIWLNALVLFWIGRKISTPASGMLAAVFYVLIGSMTNLNGDTAEIELFANLPITAGIWLGTRLLEKHSRPPAFASVGALGALCVLYKAIYLAPLAAIGAALLLNAALEQKREAWGELCKIALAIFSGFAAISGLVMLYFASLGLWPRLWLVFQLGSGYVGLQDSLPWYYILLTPAILVVAANLIFFLLGLVGATRTLVLLPRALKLSRSKGLAQLMVIVWLLASILAAGISKFGYGHYALLVIPPLALLVGAEIGDLWARIRPRPGFYGFLRRATLPGLLMLAVIGNTVYTSDNYLGGYLKYLTGQIPLDEFVLQDTALGRDNTQASKIAEYLEQRTTPEERIFTWTELAQIPYLANRRSSSDVLWPIYISRLGPPERVFASKPAYVVIGPSFLKDQPVPDWLTNDLARDYQLETDFADYQIYRRMPE